MSIVFNARLIIVFPLIPLHRPPSHAHDHEFDISRVVRLLCGVCMRHGVRRMRLRVLGRSATIGRVRCIVVRILALVCRVGLLAQHGECGGALYLSVLGAVPERDASLPQLVSQHGGRRRVRH